MTSQERHDVLDHQHQLVSANIKENIKPASLAFYEGNPPVIKDQ